MNLLERVRTTIERRGLLHAGDSVLAAVSGGPDSIAMLRALVELDLGVSIHVAHFDHRLRPDSSADADLVAEHARALGLPLTVGVADETAKPTGTSPEEAARARRKDFLDTTAADLGVSRIATGHTMDDQAETVLMRLVQGTGRRGLSGITPRRWYYVRPLIDVRRSETQAFCHDRGLATVDDPTNADRAILRNEIRLETLPFLARTLNARVVESLARLADVMRDEDAYLDERAAHGAPATTEAGVTRVPIEALRALPAALQRRALRLATWTHANVVFTVEHTERLRALALEGSTGRALDLPEGITARVEYGVLVLGPRPAEALPPDPQELIVPGETDLVGWDRRVRSWISDSRPASWPDGRWTCVLDADRIAFPVRARVWERGDRFHPLGAGGRKKVGDFFTDERVPRGGRASVPLIVDADDRVLWLLGHRIDDGVKVNDGTVRYLWLAT